MIEFDLTVFTAAIQARSQRWESEGIKWKLTLGPIRDKSAAWVTCENAHVDAELIVWTSGEAELGIVSLTDGPTIDIHYEFAGRQDLETCLGDLTERLNTPPNP